MKTTHHQATLIINGHDAGEIRARGVEASWGYGDFSPHQAFARFAPLFGTWSLLMHAEDDLEMQSEVAAQELRRAEEAIDALKVELHWKHDNSITRVEQLNIDGVLIEWKQG